MRQPAPIARARVSASPSASRSEYQEIHEPISHHSPRGSRGAGLGLRAGLGLSAGAGLGAGLGLSARISVSPGAGLSAGASLGEDISLSESCLPGLVGAIRPGVPIARRLATAIVAELG